MIRVSLTRWESTGKDPSQTLRTRPSRTHSAAVKLITRSLLDPASENSGIDQVKIVVAAD